MYVDHHAHLLAVAARRKPNYDPRDPASIAAYHRRMAEHGTTPMDDVFESDGVDDLPGAFREALASARDLGLSGITEAGLRDWSHWEALLALRERDELPIDVHVLVASGLVGGDGGLERLKAAASESDGRLAVAGVKFYGDGWLGPRTCACTVPFADTPPGSAATGVLFRDADALAERLAPVVEAGFRPATHAIGDRAIETVLDAYEKVFGGITGVRDGRPRIEHAQLLRADLIARLAEAGAVCCIQPCFAASDADHVRRAFGGAYPLAYRWDELLRAGVAVIAGSDFPIETLDPEEGMRQLTGGAHPISFDDARRIMTTPLASA